METERPEHQDFLGMPQPGQINYGNISNSGSNFTTGDIVIDSSMVRIAIIDLCNFIQFNDFQYANDLGMALRFIIHFNALDHLHYILQFTSSWILLHQNHQSIFIKRSVLQNRFTNHQSHSWKNYVSRYCIRMLRLFLSGLGWIFHISMVANVCSERCFRRYATATITQDSEI